MTETPLDDQDLFFVMQICFVVCFAEIGATAVVSCSLSKALSDRTFLFIAI